jgi:hypothetical protein
MKRNGWSWCGLAAAAWIVVAGAAQADTVLLKNGAVFQGKVLRQTDEVVILSVATGEADGATIEMEFEQSRVEEVTISEGLLTGGQSAKPVDVTRPEAPEPETSLEDELEDLFGQTGDDDDEEDSPAAGPENPMIRRYIEDLGSDSAEVRGAARERLVAFGTDATAPLVRLLRSGNETEQIAALSILSEIRDRRATLALIRELRGTEEQSAKMQWAWIALKQTTGEDLPFSETADEETRNEQIRAWLNWFESVREEYPPQLGAAPPAPAGESPDQETEEAPLAPAE